jgi:hypothetical protein
MVGSDDLIIADSSGVGLAIACAASESRMIAMVSVMADDVWDVCARIDTLIRGEILFDDGILWVRRCVCTRCAMSEPRGKVRSKRRICGVHWDQSGTCIGSGQVESAGTVLPRDRPVPEED